jgi:hypothetical protein
LKSRLLQQREDKSFFAAFFSKKEDSFCSEKRRLFHLLGGVDSSVRLPFTVRSSMSSVAVVIV